MDFSQTLLAAEVEPQRQRRAFETVSVRLRACLRLCVCARGKKCQGIHCLFSTCYYSGPNQPASQSGASGHLETLLCL